MKNKLLTLILLLNFTVVSFTHAQTPTNTEDLITFSPLENTFITCSESPVDTNTIETSTTTLQTPNCIVWSPINSSTSTTEKDNGFQVLGFLNARFLEPNQSQFISQDPVFWEIGLTNDGNDILLSSQAKF